MRLAGKGVRAEMGAVVHGGVLHGVDVVLVLECACGVLLKL